MKKTAIKTFFIGFVNTLFCYWQIILFVLLFIYSIIDYYDFHIATGYGLFSKLDKPNPIEAFTALLLIFTLYETINTRKEAVRQTELTLRPYMRISWDAGIIGDNRRAQGITDTCLVVSNNGNGLMRSVRYKVSVDNKEIGVRNHTLIVPRGNTNMVYDDDLKNAGESALGSRNDNDFRDINNKIIKENIVKINGTYRDIEGRQYSFCFISDPSEQSWFREEYRQNPIKKPFYKSI